MVIKKILVVFVLFFFIGCSPSNTIGYGILQERIIIEEQGKNPIYRAIIFDYSCNCTRTFDVRFYEDFYKPEIGSKVLVISNDLYGTKLQEN